MERTDVSYGIIPLRQISGEWQALVINQYSKIGNNTYWVFPKGHPEGVETPLQTAERELGEETGLHTLHILSKPPFLIEYSFQFDGDTVHKTVEFFLAEVSDGEVIADSDEVKETEWLSLSDALTRLDYSDTKSMFQEVMKYIEKNPDIFD